MSKYVWSTCAALLILASGLAGKSSLAKPPDLPVDLGADFEEADTSGGIRLGFDLFTGKLSLSLSLPWQLLQNWLPQAFSVPNMMESKGRPNAVCQPREAAVPCDQEPATLKQAQARRLFEIAERCFKCGDLDKARTCYEETHLLAPETSYGRQAIQRLADIDSARTSAPDSGAEEQEPKDPARWPRD